MRISRKIRYGLRALLYLAANSSEGPAPLSQIAAREEVPAAFLERILAQLRKAGLVETRRGVNGGYYLARPGEQISTADVVRALEGPISLLACVADEEACTRSGDCLSRAVWCELDAAIEATLERSSLADLLKDSVTR